MNLGCLGCVRVILGVRAPVNCVNMTVVCFEVLRTVCLVVLGKSIKSVRIDDIRDEIRTWNSWMRSRNANQSILTLCFCSVIYVTPVWRQGNWGWGSYLYERRKYSTHLLNQTREKGHWLIIWWLPCLHLLYLWFKYKLHGCGGHQVPCKRTFLPVIS